MRSWEVATFPAHAGVGGAQWLQAQPWSSMRIICASSFPQRRRRSCPAVVVDVTAGSRTTCVMNAIVARALRIVRRSGGGAADGSGTSSRWRADDLAVGRGGRAQDATPWLIGVDRSIGSARDPLLFLDGLSTGEKRTLGHASCVVDSDWPPCGRARPGPTLYLPGDVKGERTY